MNITEWAELNGMTMEEFKIEMVSAMAAIGAMELGANEDGADAVIWKAESKAEQFQVIVRRA